MINHGEKCRHCRSNMSERKPVVDGPKKGWLRNYCISCGHIEMKPPIAGSGGYAAPPQQQQQMPPRAVPAAKPVNPFQPTLLKRYGP